jgi:immunity protein, SdpI family
MRKWYPLSLVVVSAVVTAFVYSRLPERIPRHWDIHGQPNGFGPKWLFAGLFPVALLVLWGGLRALPTIDPRRANYEKFQSTYDLLVNSVLTLVVFFHTFAIATALGLELPFRLVPLAIAVVCIVLGNVLPRARPNWWFGIRTPWTLSNDRVWERTHRVGGYLVFSLGIVAAVAALVPQSFTFPVIGIIGTVTALAMVIYSYVAWRQETSR